ncbi:MAG: hypothetical protein M1816_006539 [Peltula sp. TS41687]|nr:MAG: hypothetical protein M1816_006539 [Peltula sp. TS41687]
MTAPRILIYLLRRDLRIADNPVLHEISKTWRQSPQPFTHLLPLFIFPVHQVEVSGFLSSPGTPSPYPQARSQVGGFWRCGPHRARFLAESIWDVKGGLESIGSGLEIRVGRAGEVLRGIVDGVNARGGKVVGIWMTAEDAVEERREESEVRRVAGSVGVDFRLWTDEKYFVDDRDLPFQNPRELPDVFTSYRKMVEPLRDAPRPTLPKPAVLPPLPQSMLPEQDHPFSIPSSLEDTVAALLRPLETNMGLDNPPQWPEGVSSAHPFSGGETTGHQRIQHLISTGSMSTYKDTRNGLLGEDFSTKLSAWLALGCVSARQIHEYLVAFEDGTGELGRDAAGYGKGENRGTAAVRFELLWRDYMRLCTRKFGPRLFRVEGFRNEKSFPWKYYTDKDPATRDKVARYLEGRTGTGLIDASMRELFLTGYTSNRARQNVASFLAKHLGVDWRVGAEWYESLLTDYDVNSNWGNWQYTAGVGNDPRGEARVFNPVKQAFDYDPDGAYIKAWVPELRLPSLEPMEIFQAWKIPSDKRTELGLNDVEWVHSPLKRIEYRASGARANAHGGGGRGGHAYQGRGRGKRPNNDREVKGRGAGRKEEKGRKGAMDRVDRDFESMTLDNRP